ncbi:hypothetical protein AB6C94_03550, partial [Vibrio splendidus]
MTRHESVSASLQCSLRFFQPPIPASLSATEAFPEGVIQAYRVPYVAQYQFRCPLWCGEFNDHEKAWGNLFPTLVPFGYSVLTTSAVSSHNAPVGWTTLVTKCRLPKNRT